jgi:hypothetical protein
MRTGCNFRPTKLLIGHARASPNAIKAKAVGPAAEEASRPAAEEASGPAAEEASRPAVEEASGPAVEEASRFGPVGVPKCRDSRR